MIVFWDEAANNYDPTRQFSDGGDSGSAIYNENNEIIGLHFGSHFNPANGRHYSFACHIELVETQLGLTIPGTRNYTARLSFCFSCFGADLPGIPVRGLSCGKWTDETPGAFWPFPGASGNTELGRLPSVIADHGYEIMRLINRNREVTVTWHRKQGPATAAFKNRITGPVNQQPVFSR